MKEQAIFLIWDRMGDYHRARWNALSNLLGNENVIAADLGTSDTLYKWSNTQDIENFVLLSKKPVSQFDLFIRIKKFIYSMNKFGITSVCIPGYGRLEYIIFIIISKLLNKKVVIYAESWYGRNPIKNIFKAIFLNTFCDLIFVSGTKAFNHFNKVLKIPPKKIISGYSVVDNDHFDKNDEAVDSKPILLCIARFSKEKNLERLILAYNNSLIKQKYILKLVGGGVEMTLLKNISNGDPKIVIENWASYEDLPKIYHEATIFILPSLFEPWGLVINEAMAAGLPIIASQQCGCLPDLITDENGFIFHAENEQELVTLFNKISEIPKDRLKQMGEISKKIITGYSPAVWAKTLFNGVNNL